MGSGYVQREHATAVDDISGNRASGEQTIESTNDQDNNDSGWMTPTYVAVQALAVTTHRYRWAPYFSRLAMYEANFLFAALRNCLQTW